MYFPTCVFLSKLNMFIFNKINKDLDFIKCLIKISAVHLNDFFSPLRFKRDLNRICLTPNKKSNQILGTSDRI